MPFEAKSIACNDRKPSKKDNFWKQEKGAVVSKISFFILNKLKFESCISNKTFKLKITLVL